MPNKDDEYLFTAIAEDADNYFEVSSSIVVTSVEVEESDVADKDEVNNSYDNNNEEVAGESPNDSTQSS